MRKVTTVLVVGTLLGGTAWFLDSRSGGESNARANGNSVIEEFEPAKRGQSETFEARMLSGDTLDTSSLRGEVVVFNVWGSWCVPCATEAPDIVTVATELDTQVVYMILKVSDNAAATRTFQREYEGQK